MVLAERNTENVRNGRRSRGPSPNGHTGSSPQVSSSDDENSSKKIGTKSSKTKTSEYEAEKIRVGRDYQALCPDLVPTPERKPDVLNDRALLVWSPTRDIPETKLEEYISVAKEKYGYNGEQALGMLFWHKHDLERAVLDLANFTPFPDEWTVEDKVLFEQAFQFHGKSFHRIRQMLPDKSIASLVKYYYSWKKTRNRTSVMDRKEQIKKNEGSENGSENGSNEDSDNEDKKWPLHRGIRRASGSPPRGLNDDSNSTTSVPIIQIQHNRQLVSSLKRKNSDSSEDLRPNDCSNKINSRWNSEELLLAVEGVRKYGRDFQAIAEAISTKSEAQVRTFFVNYRRRYSLDVVLKEFEAEQQQQQIDNSVVNTNNSITSITPGTTIINIKTNGQSLLIQKEHPETEIMAIDLDEEDSLPSSNTKDKDIEQLKSSADVSLIPVEKMDTETNHLVKPLETHTSITSVNIGSEISIIPCGNVKSATLAK